jgi:hypothetical protein
MSGTQQWSIRIASGAKGTVFESRVPNTTPGVLQAQVRDIISWGNATNQTHQPWPTENNQPGGPPAANPDPALFFSQPIAPNESSTPQFVVPTALAVGSVINYCCKNHPQEPTERGQIVIF